MFLLFEIKCVLWLNYKCLIENMIKVVFQSVILIENILKYIFLKNILDISISKW